MKVCTKSCRNLVPIACVDISDENKKKLFYLILIIYILFFNLILFYH